MKAIAQRFDRAAHQYDQYSGLQKQVAKRALTLFKMNAKSNAFDVCIDLGCGTADATNELSHYARVTFGIDISSKMLLQAKSKHLKVQSANSTLQNPMLGSEKLPSQMLPEEPLHFINADAENLPFKCATIDAFYSSMALQWCNEPKQIMQEIKRLMKPNGIAVLAILIDGSFSFLNQAWRGINRPSRLNQFHSRSTWLHAAQLAGLATQDTTDIFNTEHRNIIDMLGSIKRVGANHKNSAKNNLPLGRKELASLEQKMRIGSESKKQDPILLDYKLMFVCLSHIRKNTSPSPISTQSQLLEV
ncbi:methyltransferase domain-containing protein [Glaciecola petra]|uniref:Methyltransferase domain-containing protein n=1 Tax=Glaciecola petra TaxID=3075602 RepID=A0ABU2ZQM7_9ALTE|nr:methyltransferase domain-containing protein [Aestuariibacter sp. P117]MDT0594639.1 methyltransferase domain-containing protein [Aestuariibacter sp. P117]